MKIASGEVHIQKITINSAGKYTASNLESDEARVHLNSTGSATIWVNSRLKVIQNSSGDLHYRGNPEIEANTNSTGKIIRFDK